MQELGSSDASPTGSQKQGDGSSLLATPNGAAQQETRLDIGASTVGDDDDLGSYAGSTVSAQGSTVRRRQLSVNGSDTQNSTDFAVHGAHGPRSEGPGGADEDDDDDDGSGGGGGGGKTGEYMTIEPAEPRHSGDFGTGPRYQGGGGGSSSARSSLRHPTSSDNSTLRTTLLSKSASASQQHLAHPSDADDGAASLASQERTPLLGGDSDVDGDHVRSASAKNESLWSVIKRAFIK